MDARVQALHLCHGTRQQAISEPAYLHNNTL